jgi:hypothetical protein
VKNIIEVNNISIKLKLMEVSPFVGIASAGPCDVAGWLSSNCRWPATPHCAHLRAEIDNHQVISEVIFG